MKKNKLNRLLKYGILLFGISLFIVACHKDDDLSQPNLQIEKSTIQLKSISLQDLKNKSSITKSLNKLSKHFYSKKNKNSFSKIDAQDSSFVILTDKILQVNTDSTETYSFRIETPTNTSAEFENFVFQKNQDSTHAFYIYSYLEDNTNPDFPFSPTITEVDENLVSLSSVLSYTQKTTTTSCYGGYSTLEPVYGMHCDCCDGSCGDHDPYWTIVGYESVWNWNDIADCSTGGENTDSENSGGYTGNTSGSGINSNLPATSGVVIEDDEALGLRKECKKIKNLFLDYPDYKQDLINLSQTVSQQVENGIFVDDNSTNTQTVPQGIAGKLDINLNPQHKYISIAHTHDASGTYSVFSWEDLSTIADLVKKGHIKTNKFVAILITEKGTRYAFTIKNSFDFIDSFYNLESVPIGGSVDLVKMEKIHKIKETYYGKENIDAKIKTTNSNNTEVRNAFLQMVRDNDFGLEVFEIDENFETFTNIELEKNNTTVTPENCEF